MQKYDLAFILNKLDASLNARDQEFIKEVKKLNRTDLQFIFFVQTLDSSIADTYVRAILQTLGIEEIFHGRYRNCKITIHKFLTEIMELIKTPKERNLIKSYIHAIERNKITFGKACLYIFCGLLGIEAASLGLFIGNGFAILLGLLTSPMSLAVLSIVGTVGYLSYYIYKKYSGVDLNWAQKIREIFLRTIQSTLSILGCIFSITAVVGCSFVLGIFYVVARGIAVINESINLLLLERPNFLQNMPVTLDDYQHLARIESDYRKKRNSLLINFIGTILLTAVVATCCFLPPSIIISGVCFAAIAITNLIMFALQHYNEYAIDKHLNQTFKNIEKEYQSKRLPVLLDKEHLNKALQLELVTDPCSPSVVSSSESQDSGIVCDKSAEVSNCSSPTHITTINTEQKKTPDKKFVQKALDAVNEISKISFQR